MNASSQYPPRRASLSQYQRVPSLKRSHSDMKTSRPPSKWVDHDYYLNSVLRIPQDMSEDDVDHKLKKDAHELGLNTLQLSTDVEAITSSMSATTVASDPTIQSSILSQSTAPTSCSSSEVRPMTASPDKPTSIPIPPPLPPVPSILSDIEKKRRNTGFRKGFRRMTGFSRKRKPDELTSPTLASINSFSDVDASINGDSQSVVSGIKSPSIKSKESSGLWSNRVSIAGKSSYEQEAPLIDHDALRRSMECKEMISLRARQLEERQRFLDYQSELVSKIRAERDALKAQKAEVHQRIVQEQQDKNDKSVEDLESRQLEDELKMLKEHELEKRTVMIRLRHMEAYCQTPSPPPTPSDLMFLSHVGVPGDPNSARGSVDSATAASPTIYIPERRVTDKDYHNLAQQYRERDAMDNLHASKINVLRGKQKRAVENFVRKKDREIEKLEQDQQRELDTVDFEFGRQEADCRSEFDVRRKRLESRWRLQAKIARKRREDATGLKFESLPDVLCVDNCSVELMLRPTTIPAREPRDLPPPVPVLVR